MFIAETVVVFAMHEESWDRLDTNDIAELLPLLTHDRDENRENETNPNRLLKALSIRKTPIRAILWHTINTMLVVAIFILWFTLSRYWQRGIDEDGWLMPLEVETEDDGHFLDGFVEYLITHQNDGDILGMQLNVATLMMLLSFAFEYVRHRETGAVLPKNPNGGVWDPRKHGTPIWYRLLGMPSMWFTSQRTQQDLIKWIAMAHNRNVSRIYPQEIAGFALSGGDEARTELRDALADSKMFNARTRAFEMNELRRPQKLNIDLCFFYAQLHSKGNEYPGEFHYFNDEEAQDAVDSTTSSPVARISSTMSARMVTKKPIRSFFANPWRSFSNLRLKSKSTFNLQDRET